MNKKPSPNYRKPPVEHQFPKGVSGNPKGRPRKKDTMEDARERVLAQVFPLVQNGREILMTGRQLVWNQLLGQAAKGNVRAAALLIQSEPIRRDAENDPSAFDDEDLSESDEDLLRRYVKRRWYGRQEGTGETGADPADGQDETDDALDEGGCDE